MLGLLEGQADRQLVRQRRIHHAEGAHQAIVAELFLQGGVECVHRLVGDDIDAAAGRVAAIEGALRTAQHLDPVDVIEGSVGPVVAGLVDTVDVEGDGRIQSRGVVVRADAADVDLGVDEVLAKHDAGHQVADLPDVGDARHRSQADRTGRHRQGDLLDVFSPLLRGDDDFLQGGVPRGRRPRGGRERLVRGGEPGQCRCRGQYCPKLHGALPSGRPLRPKSKRRRADCAAARRHAIPAFSRRMVRSFPACRNRCDPRQCAKSLRIATRWSSRDPAWPPVSFSSVTRREARPRPRYGRALNLPRPSPSSADAGPWRRNRSPPARPAGGRGAR